MYMCVYPNTTDYTPGRFHYKVRHLRSDSWEFTQFFYSVWDISFVLIPENHARLLYVFHFSLIESCWVYEPFQCFIRCIEDVFYRTPVIPEFFHGGRRYLVSGLTG